MQCPTRPPRRRIAVVLLAALVVGCQSTYYDEYQAAHPGFRAEVPREGADLRETLASLHAPSRVETIETRVESVAIFAVEEPAWRRIAFEDVRAGAAPAPGAGYVLVATLGCRSLEGLREDGARRTAWYLLPGDALAAWDHYGFRAGCEARNAFRAARGEWVAVERETVQRLAGGGASTRVGVAEAYRRGLAYFEAGRLDEARLMLTLGEASYRTATAGLQVGDRAPEPLVEATRLRTQLMRALGVAPR